jgi:hypothetical protein
MIDRQGFTVDTDLHAFEYTTWYKRGTQRVGELRQGGYVIPGDATKYPTLDAAVKALEAEKPA